MVESCQFTGCYELYQFTERYILFEVIERYSDQNFSQCWCFVLVFSYLYFSVGVFFCWNVFGLIVICCVHREVCMLV